VASKRGSPADEGRDFPVCVEAILFVASEVRAHVSILVGAFQKGAFGSPKVFQAFVEQNGKHRQLTKLSEIASIARSAQQAAESNAGNESGNGLATEVDGADADSRRPAPHCGAGTSTLAYVCRQGGETHVIRYTRLKRSKALPVMQSKHPSQ